jgi:hypothetical protein
MFFLEISVFQGSIFEASVYPPGTLMKLMYHWAVQTPAASVLSWVKVKTYYLKNFLTLLRSACVAGLHEHTPIMGGRGKYIEIGIITLGTTVSSSQGEKEMQIKDLAREEDQDDMFLCVVLYIILIVTFIGPKPVKIEILGVFDPASKIIRTKVLNPTEDKAAASGDRLSQILWPLHSWVKKDSLILIDASIEKPLLEAMGFHHVSQQLVTPAVGSASKTFHKIWCLCLTYMEFDGI